METTARLLIRIGSQPEQEYPLAQEITILGREAINDLVINDPEVSRRHSRIMLEPEGFLIEDLGSTNGTYVNGQRVTAPMVLYHGDTIELGKSARLVFLGSAPNAARAPQGAGAGNSPYAPPVEPQQQYQQQAAAPQQQQQYQQQYAEEPGYYQRPESEPRVVSNVEDEYDDDEEAGGCQRYLIGCGCAVLATVILLGLTLFILDAVAADWLYCGPLENFWNSTFGPIVDAFGRTLQGCDPQPQGFIESIFG